VTDDVVWYIEHSLLCDSLGEDGSLGDVEVKSIILLEDFLELIQDLKYHLMYPSSTYGRDLTCGYDKARATYKTNELVE
jgi:hypothetical protein